MNKQKRTDNALWQLRCALDRAEKWTKAELGEENAVFDIGIVFALLGGIILDGTSPR